MESHLAQSCVGQIETDLMVRDISPVKNYVESKYDGAALKMSLVHPHWSSYFTLTVPLILCLYLFAGCWTVRPTVVSRCATAAHASSARAPPPWWRLVPVARRCCPNSWSWATPNDRAAPTPSLPVERRATNLWPVARVVSQTRGFQLETSSLWFRLMDTLIPGNYWNSNSVL